METVYFIASQHGLTIPELVGTCIIHTIAIDRGSIDFPFTVYVPSKMVVRHSRSTFPVLVIMTSFLPPSYLIDKEDTEEEEKEEEGIAKTVHPGCVCAHQHTATKLAAYSASDTRMIFWQLCGRTRLLCW